MKLLIKGGRVIDPANGIDGLLDVYIADGKIKELGSSLDCPADRIIDANGKWVTPGLIDLHVHLREPGFEQKETIATGTRAAARGGFTTICCMPNTEPVIDNEILVEYVKLKAEREGVVNVVPIGAVTKDQLGEELSSIGKMANAGICALSEDGKSVDNPALLRSAMVYAKMFKLPMFSHCEEKRLAGGLMNAGSQAALMGLAGISNESEELIVARDTILARSVGTSLHICHVSTAGSLEIIEIAQKRGQAISAEVTPHHFTLIDEDITEYDSNFKMSPPLRSRSDRDAILEALKSGVIEVIATDHAPHHSDEKNAEFQNAPNGIVGLETAVPLAISELVEKNVLSPSQLIEKLTINPARIAGLSKGTLSVGANADVTVIDPAHRYKIDVANFASKSSNSPFHMREVCGIVEYTIVSGEIILDRGELTR